MKFLFAFVVTLAILAVILAKPEPGVIGKIVRGAGGVANEAVDVGREIAQNAIGTAGVTAHNATDLAGNVVGDALKIVRPSRLAGAQSPGQEQAEEPAQEQQPQE